MYIVKCISKITFFHHCNDFDETRKFNKNFFIMIIDVVFVVVATAALPFYRTYFQLEKGL